MKLFGGRKAYVKMFGLSTANTIRTTKPAHNMKLSIWKINGINLNFHKNRKTFSFYFSVAKLHMHPVGLEPTTSPSTLIEREEVKFELKLIGTSNQW